MRPLSASDLLEILERGRGAAPAQQALSILEFAFPGASVMDLARLTIGQRDRCLLRLRELTFGSQLKGLADCPVCHERLELAFEAGDLYDRATPAMDSETIEPIQTEASFRTDAYEITYRLPTSADLIALAAQPDGTPASQLLLEACLISVQRDGALVNGTNLPSDVLNVLVEKMEQADPLANLTLAANCPACEHNWQIVFDIVTYLWSEISAWATRLLREVHILASAYGWREADILAMSAWRRQRYLEMIGI
jgi:hypothetical protein